MSSDESGQTRRRFMTSATLGATLAVAGCSDTVESVAESSDDDSSSTEEPEPTETPTPEGPVLEDISGEYTLEDDDGNAPTGELAKPLTFGGSEGETVTMTMSSARIDTILILEGPDGDVVAENDDNDKNLNSRLQVELEASGEYTIWCGSLFGSTGTFTFTLRRGSPPLSGEGETTSISYGESQDLSLEEGDGSDPKYLDLARPLTFEGSEGDTVTIEMNSSAFDTHLLLTGPDGAVVAENDDDFSSYDVDSRIRTTLEADGQYTIWCGSYSGDSTGSFTLTLNDGSTETTEDGTQGAEDAESIAYGTSRRYTLSEGDGIDPDGDLAKPLTFTGSQGDEVVITMTSDVLDTYLTLVDPDGDVVARNDDIDFGENLNSRIRTTLGASGEYTIWCSTFSGSGTGSFNLTLELQ